MSFAHFGGETTIQEEPQTYFGLKFQFWLYDISWKRLGKEYSGKLFGQTSLAAVLQDIAYAPDSIASGISWILDAHKYLAAFFCVIVFQVDQSIKMANTVGE